jgi:hypothetical protein
MSGPLVVAAVLCAFAAADPAPPPAVTLEIVQVDPGPDAVLGPRWPLYARVHYRSGVPLRLQAMGGLNGHDAKAELMNGTVLYPAGEGDALVWLARNDGGSIDELRVNGTGDDWSPVAKGALSVRASWVEGGATPAPAAWVMDLQMRQKALLDGELRRRAAAPGNAATGVLSALFFPLVGLTIPGYLILQVYLIKRDGLRSLSALPLAVTLPAYAFSLFSLSRGGNLWPLFTLFVSPPAFLFAAARTFRASASPSAP